MLLCDQDIKLGFHSLCSAFGTRQTWGWWASTQNRARSVKNRKLTGHIEDSNSCKVNMWQGRRNTGRGISWDEKILMFVMSNESWKVFEREWIYFHHLDRPTGGKKRKTPRERPKIYSQNVADDAHAPHIYWKISKIRNSISMRKVAEFKSVSSNLYSSRSHQMSPLLVLSTQPIRTSLAACCWDRRDVRSQSLSVLCDFLASRYTTHSPAVEKS